MYVTDFIQKTNIKKLLDLMEIGDNVRFVSLNRQATIRKVRENSYDYRDIMVLKGIEIGGYFTKEEIIDMIGDTEIFIKAIWR